MDISNFLNDSITINGKEIPAKIGFYPQDMLKFYPDNPRIYSIIYAGEKVLSQNEIEERLSDKEHVKVLVHSIKANGGLTDPLIVRGGDYVVLEGNSRLAAYRLLAQNDPIKWAKVKCKILPQDISDDIVFTLLGEYHIIGRKDWQPYEQAGYLYRRNITQKVPLDSMQKELGLKTSEIEHLIAVYSFMLKYDVTNVEHWSYYEEYLKSTIIKRIRDNYPACDKLIVTKINEGEISKAVDVRDKLIPIAKASPKIIKKFIEGKTNFEETYARATAGGAGNEVFERLHRFRTWFALSSIEDDILDNDKPLIKKCLFELAKIKKRVLGILDKLENQA